MIEFGKLRSFRDLVELLESARKMLPGGALRVPQLKEVLETLTKPSLITAASGVRK